MKFGLMFSVIFSVVSLTAVSNAQQTTPMTAKTRVIFGSETGIWRDADGGYTVYPSRRVGTIVVAAGRTVRLRFGHSAVSGRVTSIAVDPSDPSVIYQVPCEGEASAAGRSGSALPPPPVVDLTLNPSFELLSSAEWKGTCRLLVVKLTDGSDRRVRMRYL